jgi:hypothetical protein
MSTPIGSRVLALLDVKDGVVHSFGEGVYAGDFVPPEDIGGLNLGFPNPRIDLDCGKIVWGCECWWGPIEQMRKRIPESWKWEIIDIDECRKGLT